MRQVPHYLIIGNGRVATHFKYYFSLLNLSFSSWHRQEPFPALEQKVSQATHVLLLISDQAIEPFIAAHLQSSSAIRIHCSGSLVSAYAYGAHPLMTFSHRMYDLDKYRAISFVVDHDTPEFAELFPGMPNQHVVLQKSLKPKYHALCVLSGNFSCMLWQKLFNTFQHEFNIPASIAHHYLQQQTLNLITDHQNALTGPLTRGDEATIQRNMAALSNDGFQDVYKSFVTCYQAELKNEYF